MLSETLSAQILLWLHLEPDLKLCILESKNYANEKVGLLIELEGKEELDKLSNMPQNNKISNQIWQ